MRHSTPPALVTVERKVFREGWRGEPNIKDSLCICGKALQAYLGGQLSLGDASTPAGLQPSGGYSGGGGTSDSDIRRRLSAPSRISTGALCRHALAVNSDDDEDNTEDGVGSEEEGREDGIGGSALLLGRPQFSAAGVGDSCQLRQELDLQERMADEQAAAAVGGTCAASMDAGVLASLGLPLPRSADQLALFSEVRGRVRCLRELGACIAMRMHTADACPGHHLDTTGAAAGRAQRPGSGPALRLSAPCVCNAL